MPLVQGAGRSWSSIQVGIGKLNRSDSAPTTLIQAYWGGAHCCYIITAFVPARRKLQVVDFPVIDGEGLQEFPEDIDHDGYRDFMLDDTRFKGVFSSHAGSWAPPRILNMINNRLVEVSARRSFAPLFEDFTQTARAECADRAQMDAPDRNGVCAGYVAAAARLGRFNEAFREATAWAGKEPSSLSDCKTKLVDIDGRGECPRGQETEFNSFGAGLQWLLQKSEYIDQTVARRDRPLRCMHIKSSADASTAEYQARRLTC